MADQKELKDMEASPGPIPVGWYNITMLKVDGTEEKGYFCPATGQVFYTYDHLIQYVRYAKEAKFSIYHPKFEAMLKEPEVYLSVFEEGQESGTKGKDEQTE